MPPALVDKTVIIAGAGLAGLSVAHAIDRFWPENQGKPRIIIFERNEEKIAPEREGYSIGIRSDRQSGGMQALQRLGMLEDLLPKSLTALSGPSGTTNLWDLSWTPILRKSASETPPDGLPIAHTRFFRPVLRQHLIDSLPSSIQIHWSTPCLSAAQLKDTRVEVLLKDGTTAECDLLVVADGANSKLRDSLLPEDKLSYAGAVCIMGQSNFPHGVPSVIQKDWGLVIGAGTSLFVAPVDRHTAVWSVSYRSSEPRDNISSFLDTLQEKQELLEEARRRGQLYQEPFQQLIDNANLHSVRVFNAMDKQPTQSRKLGMPIVFIGDSNHAVSPFAGNGANMGLMDAVDLATELCKAGDLSEAIANFDTKSSPRAKKSIMISRIVIHMTHSTGWRLFLWVLFLRFIMLFTGSQ